MISEVQNISIEQYDYPLPDDRIAKYPLSQRDASKLLVYRNGCIEETVFHNIGSFLPADSLLISNETKVIRARLRFRKESGAAVEIFCLEPIDDYQKVFSEGAPCRWKCLVGNSKRWKEGFLFLNLDIDGQPVVLTAERCEKFDDCSLIEFSWTPSSMSFAQVLEAAGEIPLPPYLHRDAEPEDVTRYQTVFARQEGSVAAPTAGLHFTASLLSDLKDKGCRFDEVTLHVGAGTFKPVSSDTIGEHAMHNETIVVRKTLINNLINSVGKPIIAIGTTSTRTLESLYWIGVKILDGVNHPDLLHVEQWMPYEQRATLPSVVDSLSAIVSFMQSNHLETLEASTSLMIAPSYKMRLITGLITNFHQPKSTLLLLVSALIGQDWRAAYQYALDHEFRFLSYGDSCLLLP